MKRITLIAFIALTAMFTNQEALAQVSNGNDSGPGSLRQEIMDAQPGAVITFGLLVGTIDLDSEITIDKTLTIDGGTLTNTEIDADNNGRIFNITSGTVDINNIDFMNGEEVDGGAIFVSGATTTLTLDDCTFTDNQANGASGSGGAIFVDTGATITVNDSDFTNNVANRAGGAIEDNSGAGLNVTLNNVSFDGNNAGVAPDAT